MKEYYTKVRGYVASAVCIRWLLSALLDEKTWLFSFYFTFLCETTAWSLAAVVMLQSADPIDRNSHGGQPQAVHKISELHPDDYGMHSVAEALLQSPDTIPTIHHKGSQILNLQVRLRCMLDKCSRTELFFFLANCNLVSRCINLLLVVCLVTAIQHCLSLTRSCYSVLIQTRQLLLLSTTFLLESLIDPLI